jgi:hypothetical protein
VTARVGRAEARRALFPLPRSSPAGAQFQRAELVDADNRLATRERRAVERLQGPFFSSNRGSLDSFQVFDRWSET